MSPLDTILVIVNAKARHQTGLAKAALLAQKCRTRLELFAGDADAPPSALLSLARPLREGGLDVTTATVCADSSNAALLARMRDPGIGFVIKDVVHSASSPRCALTATDWELARACPVPLLLSKATLWSEVPVICAAIDPRHEDDGMECLNRAILTKGAMLAKRMGGDLHVLHAYVPPILAIATTAAGDVRPTERAQSLMSAPTNARLRELRSFSSGYQVPASHVHLFIGSACEALSGGVIQLGASIVVLGAVSRAALRTHIIGSTAEGMLKQISCDVLVVKRPYVAMKPH